MLPWKQRLYLYGINGVFIEMLFTCVYDQIMIKPHQALIGYSSAWSFLVFGLGAFCVCEPIYYYCHDHLRLSLPLRLVLYVLMIYAWEFMWGMLLFPWGANSWEYTYKYSFMGAITLEYAPFWALGALYFEFIMSYLKQIEEIPTWRKASIKKTN